MNKHILHPMALSLAALLACNPDKGDSSEASATDASTTDPSTTDPSTTDGSTTEAPGTAGPTTEEPVDTSSTGEPTTGEPGTTGQTGEGGLPCIDTPTVLAIDAETPLGVTAEAFLADKLGPRETKLTFADEPLSLSDDWKGKELPLTVELRYEGGEIRYIDSEINPEYDPTEGEGFPGECEDRLEIDVAFDFVTEALEFDEHSVGTLQAVNADRAQLRVVLLPPGLTGSFDPAALYSDPEWVVTGVEIGAIFEGAAAGGDLLNEVVVGGEGGFAGFGTVARWGDEIPF